MTGYDYSPEAWEEHFAKQARVAEWSATSAQPESHQNTNPFVLTPEEIVKRNQTEFYNDKRLHQPPSRGTQTHPKTITKQPQGEGHFQRSGRSIAPSHSAPSPSGVPILVLQWNGNAWVYPNPGNVPFAVQWPIPSTISAPNQGQTVPFNASRANPGVQKQQRNQAQPNRGSAMVSVRAAATGCTAYVHPKAVVRKALSPMKPWYELAKKDGI